MNHMIVTGCVANYRYVSIDIVLIYRELVDKSIGILALLFRVWFEMKYLFNIEFRSKFRGYLGCECVTGVKSKRRDQWPLSVAVSVLI